MMKKIINDFLQTNISSSPINELFDSYPYILSQVILNHDFIHKNEDLKPFVHNMSNYEYRDYLFKSRTILFARLVKDLYILGQTDSDKSKITNMMHLQKAIRNVKDIDEPESKKIQDKGKNNTNKISDIAKWRQIIEED